MGWNPFSGRSLTAIGTLGLSEIAGEDTMSKVPVLNALGGYRSDEQKALTKKQEQLAAEAAKQAKANQQARMQALGQSMLAFNPQNQMMAQMFGPQAAFSPQQMAQMVGDPGARSREEYSAAHQKAMANPQDKRMQGWTGDDIKRMEEDEKRRRMVAQQTTPLGPGPAPLRMPPPAAARRY